METDPESEPQSATHALVGSPWHTGLVLLVIGALAFRGKLQAEHMRAVVNPDRVAMYEHTMLFEWLVLALVLAGVWLRGSSLLTVFGDHWHSIQQVFRDIGIGLSFLIASIALPSIFGAHQSGRDEATKFLLPQSGNEMALWIALSITAGICEEAVYRGYLQKQFTALTKNLPAGIIVSALAFGAAHSYQGFARASLIAVMGAMAGIVAYWCRSVRPGMIAHILQDVLGGLIRH
jgi:membrane protease YdiL (CAAX protease family)